MIDNITEEDWKWVSSAMVLLGKDDVQKDDTISWSAYHASKQQNVENPEALVATLSIFYEKADSPSMVKHAMQLTIKVTEFLNPDQMPVMAADQPIFATMKLLQWKWPELFKKIIPLFGGLHIEKALWTCLGDMLEYSGWVTVLVQASVCESDTVDGYLKAAHIYKTRIAHEITALTLATLQQQAYQTYVNNCEKHPLPTFKVWKSMMLQYPTFRIWNMILDLEITILMFVRAHREGNLDLYVKVLQDLMFLFFAWDRQRYSRWLSVHVHDLLSLDQNLFENLQDNWTLQKTGNRFSRIPLDQVHEQHNKMIKGKGGIIGITQNPSALRRWMMSGPEIAHIIDQFESSVLGNSSESGKYRHHTETRAEQIRIQKKTNAVIQVIDDLGNPFEEMHGDLLALDTRDCTVPNVITAFDKLKEHGSTQYKNFIKNVLLSNKQSIHDRIKRNKFQLFKEPKR